MTRLLTGVIAGLLALAAVFAAPSWLFLVLCVTFQVGVAMEFVRIARHWAPSAPLAWIVPATGASLFLFSGFVDTSTWITGSGPVVFSAAHWIAFLIVVGAGFLVLLGGTDERESMSALGAFAFGVPYLAFAGAAVYRLREVDPWIVFLLFAVVWLGDSAAYYVGSRFGKHRMSPRVSPKKSWEGAAASLAMAVLVTVIWSNFRLGHIDGPLLIVAALTSVAAQLGDLLESLLKRGAGVKDSGSILPGHGGLFDRIDAMLTAAPVLWLGLHFIRL